MRQLTLQMLFPILFVSKNHLTSCSLKVVSCTNENCHVTVTRNKLQEHMTTACQWKIIRCTHCNVSHPVCKTEVKICYCIVFMHGEQGGHY